ncbi:neuropeptide Y receptor type 6-like [Orbicella faveolata]|uniref:neuropeptide Y receptor type 6-like n=1 Tax=Orbicella faveolata TaxID=48498 RepID=UPI0009E40C1B|nr:neuropeptide Y receptor type 6-like [Orbicella faveolata]XP_020626468.1 neuropeptide Y receptor type 6-like [Orbicella faveolata]
MEEPSIDNFTEEIDSSPTMNQLYFEEPAVLMITRLTIEVTLVFMGLVGNTVVSFVISRQHRFRSGLKLFIRNLAFADIGILAISFPIAVVKEQLPFYWPFGRVICLYFYPLAEVFHGVSVWSITAIAIERYRKITTIKGARNSTYISTKSLNWGLLAIWLISFLVVSLPLLFVMDFMEHNTETSTEIFCVVAWSHTIHSIYIISLAIFWYLLPLVIIVFTYVKISREIQQSNEFHKTSIRRRSRQRNLEDSRNTRLTMEAKRMRQNSKAKKILTPIVLVFTISMLPLNALRVMLLFWEELAFEKHFLLIYNVCVIGVVINSAADPLIYSIVSKDFRSELKEIASQFTQTLRNLIKLRRDDNNNSSGSNIGLTQTREVSLKRRDEHIETAILVTRV